jgi:glutathione S-transferase
LGIKLYDMDRSGHAHRVRLFLSFLEQPYESIKVDLVAGEHRSPEFLAMNPLGQIPVLVDDDVVIADSTAALVYLAYKFDDGTWLPRDAVGAAKVQRWLSAASGLLYSGPVTARVGVVFKRDIDMDAAIANARRLFRWMQQELETNTWLAADHATIADIAMYSYIRVADEGNLDVSEYPAIERWLSDVQSLSGFVAMPRG